ncbi:type III pantothenate kinase [Prochlorococcus sp. MIT 1341]|uniref:type III pantothenate kinase n=1 Tax=Prochlorococcus sp. MIT 1341 TaxID=3096221 RepID=UPI002A752FE0|nr:type III pantothenate kinase [Prochlorococcus sp. MIT 1341]
MSSGRLCLLIGNTRWHWAEEHSGEWNFSHTSPDSMELLRMKDRLAAWASVGPIPEGVFLEPGTNLALDDVPIKCLPPWLGIDRALAAWGALRRAKKEPMKFDGILVADAGTVLSLTRLNADGEFAGGQLLPGLGLQLASMAERAQALQNPGIGKVVDSKFPLETSHAMRRGSLQSLIGALIEAQIDSQLPIWLCGGDSSLLFDYLRHRQIPLALYPNLVLEGMVDVCARISSGLDR